MTKHAALISAIAAIENEKHTWAIEAIFLFMMLAYNAEGYIQLFLLFKMD
jgi:hypothetical protein